MSRDAKARAIEEAKRRAASFWRRHPRGLLLCRVALTIIAVSVVFYFVWESGALRGQSLLEWYGAVLATVSLGVTVSSWLTSFVRFRVDARADDPGHLILDKIQFTIGPGTHSWDWNVWPSTYPPNRPGCASQRMGLLWESGPDKRVREVKLATLTVTALGRDAIGCKADAQVFIRRGKSTAMPKGRWNQIGELKWFRPEAQSELNTPVLGPDGKWRCPAEVLHIDPSRGLNDHLRKPRIDILRDQSEELPIYYMRNDLPWVFLCAQSVGLLVEPEATGVPIEFDIKVLIAGEH